ncbi:mannitol dehydrogenase family protein [Aureimonas psammosilenae]|uniref:mannitol dehydrogenase family protein n=1 Tax=Aureimonas psammosilenae TaxID=2495496 RepID=UPI001260A4A9|nr:mannitol dehydrogenase family protein [Aureimonas psammosilenae]
MTRLSDATLSELSPEVERPGYRRAEARIGIVHLGLGAFHRAHQAVYTEDVLSKGDLSWGISGVSLRSPDTRDALEPQDGLYTLSIRDGSGDRFRAIGSILECLVAPQDPEAVLARMSAADTRIISLTVTEKGYCHHPATGELDEAHPDIRHDLGQPNRPKSAVGFLVEALARRREKGVPPFTVLSCDNLPANGRTVQRVVARFAALRDPALGRLIEEEVSFPSTMVDRIVPATTDADRALVAKALRMEDAWPVMAEPFTQWVIEDRFPGGRPDWNATFVEDVEPFELMKLRLLNGSHSTLAYLGYLAGHETVADAMGAPGFEALLRGLMRDEASPTLAPLPGFDLSAYRDQLLARFRNPALRHRTWQIAMDGSQKLPQRLLGTIRDRLAANQPFDRLALGVAAWMVYVRGVDEKGNAIDVRDPLAKDLAEATNGCTTPTELLDACLRFETVFGRDLPLSQPFRAAVERGLEQLLAQGAAQTVARFPEG